MSARTLAAWSPAILLILVAVFGPIGTGTAEAPAVAPGAAQLLPPGTRVQEVDLEGGGILRAPEIRIAPASTRIKTPAGWRTLPGIEPQGDVRERILWLGSDHQGRDLLARTIHGARTSILVAALAASVALALGTIIGLANAMARAPGRAVLHVFTDGALGLPRLLLLLMLGVALRGSSVGVALAIGLGSWMEVTRLVSAEARAIRVRPYATAVRASGAGRLRLSLRHILPNLSPILMTALPLVATEAVLLESTLSYLGVGGAPGAASWGAMIADGQRLLPSGWPVVVFPGILLMVSAGVLARVARSLQPRGGVPAAA